jgi:hypothetical protein
VVVADRQGWRWSRRGTRSAGQLASWISGKAIGKLDLRRGDNDHREREGPNGFFFFFFFFTH